MALDHVDFINISMNIAILWKCEIIIVWESHTEMCLSSWLYEDYTVLNTNKFTFKCLHLL